MSEVALTCDCGKQLQARFQDAGGKLSCSCGSEVSVPSLGKLRQLAGQDAYTTNAVEAIRKSRNLGQLPAGRDCLVCRAQNCSTYSYLAICEKEFTKGADSAAPNDIAHLFGMLLFVFTLPRILALYLLKKRDSVEVQHFGRDTSVEIELPICDSCASGGHSPKSTKVARKLMEQVDLYNQLLSEYPSLTLERRDKTA